jgi:hypothetical protein
MLPWMLRRVLILGLVLASLYPAGGAVGAVPRPLKIGPIRQALTQAGFPARIRCGLWEPVPTTHVTGRLIEAKPVRKCSVLVEHAGFSIVVLPFSDAASAQAAYKMTHNRWATKTWDRVIGNVLVRAYRLSAQDQARVFRTIAALKVNRD